MDQTNSPVVDCASDSTIFARIRALIIDDEAHVRSYVRLTLQSLGVATTWEAADGGTGLALYAEQTPDVVFLDVNMPTMPGSDTMEQLLQIDPDANVVIITSDSAHQTVRKFLELGAIGYVLKQRPPEEFRSALYELLSQFAE